MKGLCQLALDLLKPQYFDCLAVGVIDFKKGEFKSFQLREKKILPDSSQLYFDLASVTKPLTLAASYFKNPKLFDAEMQLLLNHSGGLLAWGRLSHESWKEQVLSYPIAKAETVYSDFSALRLMLEIEKKAQASLFSYCGEYFDRELVFWKDLKDPKLCPVTGYRNRKALQGAVHDDNCFVINAPTSHAGLFATVKGLCLSLLNFDKKWSLLETMEKSLKEVSAGQRFVHGWDRATPGGQSLAGKGAGEFTFGHLGFTGTSVWIDSKRQLGSVILSNGTLNHWYAKEGLNAIRRKLGEEIWSKF